MIPCRPGCLICALLPMGEFTFIPPAKPEGGGDTITITRLPRLTAPPGGCPPDCFFCRALIDGSLTFVPPDHHKSIAITPAAAPREPLPPRADP